MRQTKRNMHYTDGFKHSHSKNLRNLKDTKPTVQKKNNRYTDEANEK